MERTRVCNDLFEVSINLETTADTLQMFVSLFNGNSEEMPHERVIGSALYGVIQTITKIREDVDRITKSIHESEV